MNNFKNNKPQNLIKIERAVKKYGINHFKVVQLLRCSKEYLNKAEQIFIKYYDSKSNGYNCTYGGEGTSGHIVTKEHIEKQKKKMSQYWTDERKKEHVEKMKLWANDDCRRDYLISIGKDWINDADIVKKHKNACQKSMTFDRIEKQKASINKRYELNGGKQNRYKKIELLSPKNEIITITKVSQFCKSHNIGTMGFYRFLRNRNTEKNFRGWKFISAIF